VRQCYSKPKVGRFFRDTVYKNQTFTFLPFQWWNSRCLCQPNHCRAGSQLPD